MTRNAKIIDIDTVEPTQVLSVYTVDSTMLQASYDYCGTLTKSHYENFPVASRLVPKELRPHIQAIYAFSRTADDFADEADYHGVRLKKLDEWEKHLKDFSKPTHPIFIALHNTINEKGIPIKLLLDLLTAFRMDVQKKRYETFDEVLNYCKYSANPVGRLVLCLFGKATRETVHYSDAICTALQLANFWQDVSVDLKKDRVYVPSEDLEKFALNIHDFIEGDYNEKFKRLMQFQVSRTAELFEKGKPLGLMLDGQFGLEIRLTILGGMSILKKIKQSGYDVFHQRPTLSKWDFAKLFWVALSKKRFERFKV